MKDLQHITTFLDGVSRYFAHVSNDPKSLELGTPYLVRNHEQLGLDLTGAIAISGKTKGFVFFSSSRALLKYLLMSLGESEFSDQYMADIVGEVANTISGNVRKTLGTEFHISTPKVIRGHLDNDSLKPERLSYVLPLKWRGNTAQLIVSLDSIEAKD